MTASLKLVTLALLSVDVSCLPDPGPGTYHFSKTVWTKEAPSHDLKIGDFEKSIGNNITLVGGGSNKEGNVLLNGKPICDDDWDDRDAKVVCRMLGFSPDGAVATHHSQFGLVSGDFIMDDVLCQGSETDIYDCNHRDTHNCGGHEGAGVRCGVSPCDDELKEIKDENEKLQTKLSTQDSELRALSTKLNALTNKLDGVEKAVSSQEAALSNKLDGLSRDLTELQGKDFGNKVIQRRGDFGEPREDFNRDWADYKNGFGDLNKEFWLGNDQIHELTKSGDMKLRVELEAWDGRTAWAEYDTFRVEGEDQGYKLHIGGYTGTAGDSMTASDHSINGMKFSTREKDNDKWSGNCAQSYNQGGWWIEKCGYSFLNGVYYTDPDGAPNVYQGIIWYHWLGKKYSLKSTTMMIRSKHSLSSLANLVNDHETKLGSHHDQIHSVIVKTASNSKNIEGISSVADALETALSSQEAALSNKLDGISRDLTELQGKVFGNKVIQRRGDFGEPREDFNRDWADYKNGFGDLNKEFWLGNEQIHELTKSGDKKLRVELEAWDGRTAWAEYDTFRVEGEDQGYKLHIGGYTGTAGDSMTASDHSINGMKFSTRERDNDKWSGNCAQSYNQGGWWIEKCGYSFLNGVYYTDPDGAPNVYQGIIWYHWLGSRYSLKSTTMMIRSKHSLTSLANSVNDHETKLGSHHDQIHSVIVKTASNSKNIDGISTVVDGHKTKVDNVAQDMLNLKASDQQQETRIVNNIEKLKSVSRHGKWCGYQDGWGTVGTITYDRLSFSDSNLNTGTPLNINTGIFTVPVSGVWRLTFSLASRVESGAQNIAWLYINGDQVGESYHYTFSGSGRVLSTGGREVTRELSKGDTIELRATQMGRSDGYTNITYCAEYVPTI